MNKSLFAFINCNGQIIAQNIDHEEAGVVVQSLLKQKAVILPVTCNAANSSEALEIFNDRVQDNLHMLDVFGKKESTHVN
ncbi:hypothetical protein [Vibrio sp. SCSIO 43137]|uniref:hypothetical protein n=1 Tax=Vibrio sp. SCSIO 43137 TaxID=3021011 RepID=UPI002307C059|nr:hypothetical protein [Vibrio sp. SCSIO 43137]WCE32246.1 hypothetical protein PK654_17270 [Vibrio sp. SCSIO 43137]